jgi:hypothetical protein
VQGSLCRSCIDATFWRMTAITFFFGWWGIISFFTTLFILPSNIATYFGAMSLPRGGGGPPAQMGPPGGGNPYAPQ